MKRSLLLLSLLAMTLAACSKKEETIALPAPAITPALSNVTTGSEVPKTGETAPLTLPTEQKPAGEDKPAN